MKGQGFTAPGFHGLCVMCLLSSSPAHFHPSLFYLKSFGPLYWLALICLLLKCGLPYSEPEEERHGETETEDGWQGERERRSGGGVESLQGKWMVGMRVVAQWMSRTLGWEVLQVLCRGSRGHSGCDWHQNNISWQATLVTGRGWPSMRRPHLEYQQPSPFYGECCMIGNSFISFVFYVIESMKLCQ